MVRRRLLWRLYAGHVFLTVLTTALLGALILGRIEASSLREVEDALHSSALLLSEVARQPLRAGEGAALNARVLAMPKEVGVRMTVIRRDGTVVADSQENPARMDNHGSRPEVEVARTEGIGRATRFSQTLGVEMMYLALPVVEAEEGLGFVRTAVPLTTVQARLRQLRGTVVLVAAVSALVASLLGFWLVRRFTRSMRNIAEAAAAIARGDTQQRVEVDRNDELGAMASAINEMAHQLDQRIDTITTERNQVQAILASMLEGVVAVDRARRVVHMNAAAREILGIDSERPVLGSLVWDVTQFPEISAILTRTITSNEHVRKEIEVPGEDTPRHLELHAAPLRGPSRLSEGAVAVLADITELRRLETVRTEFVSNVSHELKTPLAAVRGLVETLLDDSEMDRSTQERFLGKLASQTGRLSALVLDLLVLSRVESRPDTLQMEVVDLREPAQQSAQAIFWSDETAESKVEFDLAMPDETVQVRGDLDALRTLFDNLLSNALNYTAAGGSVRLDLRVEGNDAVCEVRDTGIGIDPQHLPRIFERFYRVDSARSREHGGTGLGLSIVKHIALSHGGNVEVESKLNEGSTFRVQIPLAT